MGGAGDMRMTEETRRELRASASGPAGDGVAAALVELMPRDAIFALRFLGESRVRLLEHFQAFILGEFAKAGATPQTHPMLHAFSETHAVALRDFVVSGVEGAHQISLEHMERLMGDRGGLLRVDIWDQLQSHIGDAEAQFQRQVEGLQADLETYRAPR
jgi:hypothetical protein